MQDKIIFISKDALRKGALSFYGNKYWNTKNIDELAHKGTVYEVDIYELNVKNSYLEDKNSHLEDKNSQLVDEVSVKRFVF